MRCVCCNDHIHIVLGEGELSQLSTTQFGWPLFFQTDVLDIKNVLLNSPETAVDEKCDVETFFDRVLFRTKRQARGEGSRFTGAYLPKINQGIAWVDRSSLVRLWFDFADGKADHCDLIYATLLGPQLRALHDCSLVEYETKPSSNFFRKKVPLWRGKFSTSSNLEVVE